MATTKYTIEELASKFLFKHLSSSIDVTTALNINYNQLYVLIIFALDDQKKFYEFYGSRIKHKDYMAMLREDVNDLVASGYLEGKWFNDQDFPETTFISPKMKEYILKMFSTNEDTTKKVLKKERELENLYMKWANQFVKHYPHCGYFDNGSKPPLQGCKHPSLNINSLSDFKKYYIAQIGRDEALHIQIIEALKKYKDGRKHPVLNMGMVNFVASQAWEKIINCDDEYPDYNDRLVD